MALSRPTPEFLQEKKTSNALLFWFYFVTENEHGTLSRRKSESVQFAQRKDTRMDKWRIYQDAKGEWRWERIAPNGRIVGASSEGYKNRADCVANAKRNGYTGT